MDNKVKSSQVGNNYSLKNTLSVIDKSGLGMACVVDKNNRLLGVVTDGDIRRALIRGAFLEQKISELKLGCPVTLKVGYNRHHVLRLFGEQGKRIKHVPVVDEKGRVIEILSYTDYFGLKDKQDFIVRAKAPLRASFSGGGTDVNQYIKDRTGVILSCTINKHCYGTLKRRNDSKIIIRSHDYHIEVEIPALNKIKYNGRLDLAKAVINLMQPDYGMEISLKSDVPPGTGLGGSSAMAVVIIGLLNYFRADKLDEYQVAEMAYQAERIELNISGGWQDQYAAVFGGFNFMEFTRDDVIVHPLKIKPETLNELQYHLLMCFTGKTRNSGLIVREQTRSYVAGEKAVVESFENIKRITYALKNALLKGHLLNFGRLLHEAWEQKKRFNRRISDGRINKLYRAGIENGAVGGKVLGAGGGGYILFFCGEGTKENIASALTRAGGEIMDFNFDFHGLQVWPVASERDR